ncbi:MAG: type II toxin-antitoxin system VapC family toxin [Bryobacterales bacterium]|nr:type II toxin-antitoxin system VapC family toxin [Bryobacterales bacterium]
MRLAFCDSSALVKLIVDEPESAALRQSLGAYSHVLASELAEVEVPRAVRRSDPGRVVLAQRLIRNLETVALDQSVIKRAASLDPVELRSMDAVQLACALRLGPLDPVFIAYDKRIIRAASAAGLRTLSPE